MTMILDVQQLCVHFPVSSTVVRAVDGVDINIEQSETLAVIGESGSGKSVLGLALLGLLPANCTVNGVIRYHGDDLLTLSETELEMIRGRKIAWVPQNPAGAMNPSMTVGNQIGEPISLHIEKDKNKIRKKVLELLKFIRITPPEERINSYPYSFSGGMLQRSLVAMGISGHPEVLIADEPTKGIDIMNKQAITYLLRALRDEGITLIIITHDLPFAKNLADRIAVMYSGRIVEIRGRQEFFDGPLHPYSRGLLRSLPENGLHPIPSVTGDSEENDGGCKFRFRCASAIEKCRVEPPLIHLLEGSAVRCWLYD
ncbi:Oligopeptide transport system permease protein OppB [Methanosarcina barkeri str. Wiesmoor]|uniref:Nickel import system ATP-binding protein NikD n=2 Tax=Methanosarcina barkeri TaxID=2208 RepID=A0A0E3LLX1_METBA|nr:ABC transporter ATP-binding protein [Methanosarcina barkeri]AKB52011.1 Oligopeptide transport system permease protein OppB [Methanosarcina barkeri str. Wiesmoor]